MMCAGWEEGFERTGRGNRKREERKERKRKSGEIREAGRWVLLPRGRGGRGSSQVVGGER